MAANDRARLAHWLGACVLPADLDLRGAAHWQGASAPRCITSYRSTEADVDVLMEELEGALDAA